MLTTHVRSLALAASLLAPLTACKAQDTGAKPDDKPAESPSQKAAAPTAPGATAPATTAAEPPSGEFTLEAATAGLEGKGKLMAKIATPKGDIVCELFADQAPKTVASFIGLARGLRAFRDPDSGEWKKGNYFDGLAFHRVIPAFMIQGGDILSRNYSNLEIGSGGPGYMVPNETSPALKFDRPGRLAMANAGPDTNGSQFFVTEVPRPSLDGGYTIFGQCDGLEVVKTIARVEVDSPRHNKPLQPITMKVEIFRK